MNSHQALGHMRSLMMAQHFFTQALLRAKARDVESAKEFMRSAAKETSTVKEALSKTTELNTHISMLRLFLDDLEKQRVDSVEKEILIQSQVIRAARKSG